MNLNILFLLLMLLVFGSLRLEAASDHVSKVQTIKEFSQHSISIELKDRVTEFTSEFLDLMKFRNEQGTSSPLSLAKSQKVLSLYYELFNRVKIFGQYPSEYSWVFYYYRDGEPSNAVSLIESSNSRFSIRKIPAMVQLRLTEKIGGGVDPTVTAKSITSELALLFKNAGFIFHSLDQLELFLGLNIEGDFGSASASISPDCLKLELARFDHEMEKLETMALGNPAILNLIKSHRQQIPKFNEPLRYAMGFDRNEEWILEDVRNLTKVKRSLEAMIKQLNFPKLNSEIVRELTEPSISLNVVSLSLPAQIQGPPLISFGEDPLSRRFSLKQNWYQGIKDLPSLITEIKMLIGSIRYVVQTDEIIEHAFSSDKKSQSAHQIGTLEITSPTGHKVSLKIDFFYVTQFSDVLQRAGEGEWEIDLARSVQQGLNEHILPLIRSAPSHLLRKHAKLISCDLVLQQSTPRNQTLAQH